MPPFPKPTFPFNYLVADEIAGLRSHRETRGVPKKPSDRVVLATWNLANFGVQERRPEDYELLVEMIGWFDLVALQEVNEDLEALRSLLSKLPTYWIPLFTDSAGNNERLCFLYDSTRVRHWELAGEVALMPEERRRVKLPDVQQIFEDFNRSPYLCGFEAGQLRFTLMNAHIYYGAASGQKFERRRLEVFALANWAKNRQKHNTEHDRHLMIIGDLNVPKAREDDKVFRELLRAGMKPPASLHGTAIGGDTLGLHRDYDQIVMFPRSFETLAPQAGVFDFDTVVFRQLWGDGSASRRDDFFGYVRYYLSDHRLLWASLKTV